jgi:hypothetical protein
MSRERGIVSMPWFRMSSSIYADPEVRDLTSTAAGLRAFRLFIFAIGWSVQMSTDGHVPKSMLELLGGTRKDVIALIDARMFEYVEGGYRIRTFAEWQQTTEDQERKREIGRMNQCARWMKEGRACVCGQHTK